MMMWRRIAILIVSAGVIGVAFSIYDALRPLALPRPIHVERVSATCSTLPTDPLAAMSSGERLGMFINDLGLPRLDCGAIRADEVYRFAWGHAFNLPHPISVTVTRSGTTVTVDAREYQLAGQPPYPVVFETIHNLTMNEWRQIANAVDTSPFWALEHYQPDGAVDGGSWIIEARVHDGYHRAWW